MKILAIMASPRKDGKTAKMLSIACGAATKKGHEIELYNLYNMNIKPCTGCMKCRTTSQCVIKDDIETIRQALYGCDMVILAAPTYFANVPAPVKNMFDRLSGAVMSESKNGIPKGRLSKKQKYLLITACTTPAPFDKICGQSSGSIRAMKEFFNTAGMSCMGKIVFAGTKNKTEIPQNIISRLKGCF